MTKHELATWFRYEINRRGITQLCHFTRLSVLQSIRAHGLCNTQYLQQNEIPFIQNDRNRFDGHSNYISSTVQFPNIKLLKRWRRCDSSEDWVILFLNPELLCQNVASNKFSPTNAAFCSGGFIMTGTEGFNRMFAAQVETRQGVQFRDNNLQACSTTNVQAEVLLHQQKIDWSNILTIVVQNERNAERVSSIDSQMTIKKDSQFFQENGIGDKRRGRM